MFHGFLNAPLDQIRQDHQKLKKGHQKKKNITSSKSTIWHLLIIDELPEINQRHFSPYYTNAANVLATQKQPMSPRT